MRTKQHQTMFLKRLICSFPTSLYEVLFRCNNPFANNTSTKTTLLNTKLCHTHTQLFHTHTHMQSTVTHTHRALSHTHTDTTLSHTALSHTNMARDDIDRAFAQQVWHKLHWVGSWAGVALGDINLTFVWQAGPLLTLKLLLRGRRGAW